MINKEVYENITEEKLCFCDSRPDKSINKVMEYLWKDERNDYHDGEWGCDNEDHIYHDLLRIRDWMYNSRKEVQ